MEENFIPKQLKMSNHEPMSMIYCGSGDALYIQKCAIM